jgi:hypothetical protein
MGRLTGAGSDALHPMVTGPARSAVVVGAGPYATYLEVQPSPEVQLADTAAPIELLAVISRGSVRVPCAIVLADGPASLPGLVRGARAQVGDGVVSGTAASWPSSAGGPRPR